MTVSTVVVATIVKTFFLAILAEVVPDKLPYGPDITGCPSECACYVPQDAKNSGGEYALHVDCGDRNLTYVPNFSKVVVSTMHYKYIETVILRKNKLSHIADDAFSSFMFTTLDISSNLFKSLPYTAINESRARELDISDNGELKWTEDMFADGNAIEVLRARSMGLTQVPGDSLKDIRNLRHLDLANNAIDKIRSKDFQGFETLRVINLSGNKIASIEDKAFNLPSGDKEIDLRRNVIIKTGFYKPCRDQIKRIWLNDNPIHCDCVLFNKTRNPRTLLTGTCFTPAQYRRDSLQLPLDLTKTTTHPHFPSRGYKTCGGRYMSYDLYDCDCHMWWSQKEFDKKHELCTSGSITFKAEITCSALALSVTFFFSSGTLIAKYFRID